MAAPLLEIFELGDVVVSYYTFVHKGDVLPSHTHGPDDVHASIVAREGFIVRVPARPDAWWGPGCLADWQPGVYHEFEATGDDAVLINIQKVARRKKSA